MVRTFIVTAVALAFFAAPALADKPAPAPGGGTKPADPNPADLTGTVVLMAEDGKIITIELPGKAKGEAGEKVIVKLTSQTTTKTGKTGEVLKPELGDRLSVWLVAGSKDTAQSIAVTKVQKGTK